MGGGGGRDRQYAGGNSPRPRAAAGDDGPVSDGDAGHHLDAGTDPDVAAHPDGMGILQSLVPLRRRQGVAGGVKAALGADEHVVPKGHAAGVQNDAAVVHVKIPPHGDIDAVVAPEGRLDPQPFSGSAQQAAQQGLGRLDIRRLIGQLIELPAQCLAGGHLRLQGRIVSRVVQHSPQHLFPFCHGLLPCIRRPGGRRIFSHYSREAGAAQQTAAGPGQRQLRGYWLVLLSSSVMWPKPLTSMSYQVSPLTIS